MFTDRIICGSSTKLFIADRCNRLGDDIIEAIECLKSWSLAGFRFAGSESEIKEMENTLNALEVHSLAHISICFLYRCHGNQVEMGKEKRMLLYIKVFVFYCLKKYMSSNRCLNFKYYIELKSMCGWSRKLPV